jgi:hypothetical protein
MVTFMADERYAPTENEGERPPKMRWIRNLPDEEIEEESKEEPFETRKKRRGLPNKEANKILFYWLSAGRLDQRQRRRKSYGVGRALQLL